MQWFGVRFLRFYNKIKRLLFRNLTPLKVSDDVLKENITIISEMSWLQDLETRTGNLGLRTKNLTSDVFHYKMRSLWMTFTNTLRLITHNRH